MELLLCVLSLMTLSSCIKVNGSDGNDNTGIEFRMRNKDNGWDGVSFGNAGVGLAMSSSNNFFFPEGGYSLADIASIGRVNSLSGITTIPNSGWCDEIAVHPGTGYVIRYKNFDTDSFHYGRVYVEEWIESTSGGIIGAVLWYENNWK